MLISSCRQDNPCGRRVGAAPTLYNLMIATSTKSRLAFATASNAHLELSLAISILGH